MILTSTLTEKGQTTIPKKFRDILGLHPGQVVRFEQIDTHTISISRPLTAAEVRTKVGSPKHDQPLTAKEKERLTARGLLL